MKRLLFFIVVATFALVIYKGLKSPYYRPVSALAIDTQSAITGTATPQPTPSIVPTVTVDYQATLVIAQQTADEARRVNAMVTAEYQQRAQEQLQMTAQFEQRVQEIYSWTATAALTAIPLTATQQSISNTQAVERNQIVIAQMTATAAYPTQIIAVNNAMNKATFGKAYYVFGMFAIFSLGVLMLSGVYWIAKNPVMAKTQPEIEDEGETEPAQPETVVWVQSTKDNGAASVRHAIPCTPEQLSELAENITQGKKTLAVNKWEGKETLFTREVILRVRSWLRDNQLVTVAPDGQLVPTNELLDFLMGWLDRGALPADYEFESPHSPEAGESSKSVEIPANHAMRMRIMPMRSGGEEVTA